jgi:hypothetical protein
VKRWIALLIGIIALAAGFVQLRRMAARDVQPTESISAASHAQLEDVLRRTASVPRSAPQTSGEVHRAAVPRSEPQASGEVHKAVDEDRR